MKQEITIPTSVGDIKLGQWQKYAAIEEKTHENAIQTFCDIDSKQLMQLPQAVYDQVVNKLAIVLEQVDSDVDFIQRFTLNGTEYGMIPNLDEITYGENKDLMQYLGDWKTMHLAMSVLFRPITQTLRSTYSIEKYKGTKEHRDVMQHMPLDIVLGAQLFFYSLTEDLLRAIPNYLERVVRNSSKEQMQDQSIKQTGEAMMKYSASLRETLEGLRR
jgi:hypothetical protein